MAKKSKRDVESISARVAKHASKKVAKAEVNLKCSLWIDHNNWLSIALISTENLAYFISIFSLVSWFVLFVAAPALSVRRTWNLMGTSVRNGQQLFILFRRKYYFIQKLKFSYYNNIFRNVFQTSGVIGLITLLYAKLQC